MNRQANRSTSAAKRPSSTHREKAIQRKIEDEKASSGDGTDLPLLDEVNQVIEKEKTLISLQLLEQQRVAQEWKQKYDSLVGQVVTESSSGVHGDLRALEIVADSATSNLPMTDPVNIAVDRGFLLHKIDELGIILNVSNVDLDVKAISEINKLLNEKESSKSSGSSPIMHPPHADINVVVLRNCGLEDKHTEALSYVLANPKVKGFDLSDNNLGTIFQAKILDTLKNRKLAPQYVILCCNKAMAKGVTSAKISCSNTTNGQTSSMQERNQASKPANKQLSSLGNIVNCVTSSTWGICVTLEDFDPFASIEQLQQQQQKTSKKTQDTNDINTPASHLMLSYSFLKKINQALDPLGETEEDEKFDAGVATIQREKKSIVAVKRVKKPDTNSYRNGLSLMSVLGLVYAQLSKQTIKELMRTMQLSAASLTDLDLSFAFVGFYGAKMISSFLSKKECQLIRLGLAGNDIGSAGALEICRALENNMTLTFLDCSSNSITNDGLLAMIDPLSRNNILYRLCLNGGNNLSRDKMIHAENYLYYRGSDLQIKWSSTYQKLVPDHSLSLSNYEVIVYNVPQKKFVNMNKVGEATLYTIDLKFINPIFAANQGRNLAFRWMWKMSAKPSILYNLESYKQNRKPKVNSKSNNKASLDESNHLGQDQNQSSIAYEVRILSHTGDIFQSIKLPVPRGLLTSLHSLQQSENNNSGSSDWIDTSVPVLLSNQLPSKGTIEIRLLFLDVRAIDIIRDFRFETVRLTVFPIIQSSISIKESPVKDLAQDSTVADSISEADASTKYVAISGELMGGDFAGWTDAVSDALCTSHVYEVFLQPYKHFIPGGFSVLRLMCWHSSSHSAGFIKMEIKLKAALFGSKISSTVSFPSSTSAAESSVYTFGYEYLILVISAASGTRRIVLEGSSESSISEVNESLAKQQLNYAYSDDQKHKQVLKVLKPWNWNELVAQVNDLEANDLIVICGKATSMSSTVSESDVSKRSVVSLRNCKLFCEKKPYIERPIKDKRSAAGRQINATPREDFVDGLMTSVFAVHNDPSLNFIY